MFYYLPVIIILRHVKIIIAITEELIFHFPPSSNVDILIETLLTK